MGWRSDRTRRAGRILNRRGSPTKKAARGAAELILGALASEGVEEQVGEETIELNQDSGRDGEPDGGENRSGRQKLFHRQELDGWGDSGWIQRGETVILSSLSVSFLPVNSPKAARGQLAAARVLLNASGTSIWISRMVASLLPRIAIR